MHLKFRGRHLGFFHFQTKYQRNSNGFTYIFGVQLSIGTQENTMRPNWKWTNSRRRPLNFKCLYLRFQTRYQRNSNGFTYIFGVQLSIGTHENTMRPNRKWKNPRWWPLNFKCMYLRLYTRWQRNSNGYTYVFEVQLSNNNSDNVVRPNRKIQCICRMSIIRDTIPIS